jgi:ABC-2 type transport system ATP-binding protein
MIEFKNVKKSFGQDQVLKDVSFTLNAGEFAILIGHNGVGKSTILNLIVQNEFHDSGKIFFKGEDIDHPHYFHQKEIAFIHEKINYKLPFSMQKFIEIYKSEFPRWDHELFRRMVYDRKLDLSKKFTSYSRGQKMQLALIIALARKPKLLLIDEITAVLDLPGQKYFLSYLKEYVKQGNSVLLTTNIISEAQNFCDKVILLNGGKVEYHKQKVELLSQFVKLEILQKDVFRCDWLKLGILTEEVGDKLYYIFERKGTLQDQLPAKEVPLTLEDIFIYLYHHQRGQNYAYAI